MSLPVVLPGSCCSVPRLGPLPQAAAATTAGTAASAGSLSAAAADPSLPPLRSPQGCDPLPADGSAAPAPAPSLVLARPLLSLGLLQVVLGCSLVALNFGALSLSSASPVKNSYPFWAGSSVILCGILGIMTWKRPMMLLANLFVLLSIICVLLNLAGFILGCQGVQFVSGVPRCDLVDMGENKICFCCEEFHLAKCTEEEAALTLYHMKSCSAGHHLLKKALFALCALNALTITVCMVAAALRYLRIFATRRSCIDESHIEDQDQVLDPDDFVPPVPPPSYFATLYSCAPQMSCRMLCSDVIPLPHIYRARIKDVEVFCPLDPPPPYEAVQSQNSSEQEGALQISVVELVDSGEVSDRQASQGEEIPVSSSRVSLSPSNASLVPAEGARRRAFNPLWKQSKSDPVLHCWLLQGAVLSCEAAKQAEVKPQLCTVTFRKSLRARALRGRPQSLIDYKSYTDTKRLVAWILEQPSCNMSPDIHELVENIKSVLKSDEKHMAEAITSATFLEQVTASAQQAMSSSAHMLPLRWHSGLLHLESCGDLSTFTTDEDQLAERKIQRAEHERPHSLIGVVRETVL
ncbi:endosomal transmembrane epsin interactor 1 [Gymnogyps californianus]|uniref:endosomal transmembrane epsin interactor 1 n=1 Tax=Gymnogyps californianus TaxID=33616 RepID=UPI0021C7B6BF|nr:endosomal transmembrane epsin interactor 1 [Gymnogyps californianus]